MIIPWTGIATAIMAHHHQNTIVMVRQGENRHLGKGKEDSPVEIETDTASGTGIHIHIHTRKIKVRHYHLARIKIYPLDVAVTRLHLPHCIWDQKVVIEIAIAIKLYHYGEVMI